MNGGFVRQEFHSSLPLQAHPDLRFKPSTRVENACASGAAALYAAADAIEAGRARIATDDGALPADYAECHAYVEELKAAGQLTPQMLARFLRSGGTTSFLIALAQLPQLGLDWFQPEKVPVTAAQLPAAQGTRVAAAGGEQQGEGRAGELGCFHRFRVCHGYP